MMKIAEQTILVVEDDPNDVLLIQQALDQMKLANPLQVVYNGEAAIAYLSGQDAYVDRERHPLPALMLLNLKLPRKSGFEVLAWVRQQQPGLNRLPVVIFSSSNHKKDINRAYELGANSYLVKPVRFQDLMELMQTFLRYWLTHSEQPEVDAP